jgi:uncharacterized protein YndB with AHSA1/START domain
MGVTSRFSRTFKAPPMAVYQAFLDRAALAFWLAPDGMTAKVHDFTPQVDGTFRISLTYDDPAAAGKTAHNVDTYTGRFVTLKPYDRIVKDITFETANPAFAGTMRITVALAKADRGTELTVTCDNIPAGISPKDNETGWKMSLKKLAKLVE